MKHWRSAATVLAVAGIGILLYGYFLLSTPVLPGPGVVEMEIPEGTSTRAVLDSLRDRDLIRSVPVSYLYIRYKAREPKAGYYRFTLPSQPAAVLNQVLSGQVDLVRVTIPEGWNRFQIAELLERSGVTSGDEFLALSGNPAMVDDLDPEAPDCEGFLFPETYRFARAIPARRVLSTLIEHFRRTFRDHFQTRLLQKGLTVHRWVIMASLVESEAQARKEKPIISGVFYNRLQRGMLLQCDPTVRYALILAGEPHRRLGYAQLRFDHPYNTYIYRDLPPGAICNPGRGALEASLSPSDTRALYFVARNDGTHAFSSTLQEHTRYVNQYQRGGGS
ncbi:MAG TPA: endolytic transglycosylase MltG [Thermoanaerobaculia bacterium]|nr:endolytic transglycosylase MltG [Thermoanaerobaculia bacterium]HUM28623.1 endolytic transglycosylase MltG [Thermoanaerobaculia bacterium]HXK66769.1 endolytic transglycosylase MltG [Thermoanaerobaculia bacterium]